MTLEYIVDWIQNLEMLVNTKVTLVNIWAMMENKKDLQVSTVEKKMNRMVMSVNKMEMQEYKLVY